MAASAALVAAVVAARHTAKLLAVESGRDSRAEQEGRETQARRVSAWVAVNLDGSQRLDGFVLDNASDAPIHDVRVTFESPDYKSWRDATMLIVPPGRFFTHDGEPTYGWHFPDHVDAYGGTIRPVMKKGQWRVAQVTFTDSAGVRWTRDGRGLLASA